MRRDCVGWLILLLLLLAAACGYRGASLPQRATASPSPAALPSAIASPSPTPAPPEVTLVAAGDVMLGRSLGDSIRRFGPLHPFEHVIDILKGADITFVNLESPLSEGGEPAPKDFVFRGPPEAARGLAEAGVDIVSLANNHALDYGLAGLAETRGALAEAGVAYVGAGDNEISARSPVIIERRGLRLAFLAYVNTPRDSVSGFDVSGTVAAPGRPGVAWATPEAVTADVASASRRADVVILSLHTGSEYQEPPNDLQVALARAAIDAGAALVLGHHPHVLQGIERYKDGLIIYSLGNFVFDFDAVDYAQPGLPSALSTIVEVRLTKDGVAGCRLLPIGIDPADGRPHPAEDEEAQAVLDRMTRLSGSGPPIGAGGSCGL